MITITCTFNARSAEKPYRDPCIWGTSMVGNEPIPEPVDPLAEVKAAWEGGKRVRLSCSFADWGTAGLWMTIKERPSYFNFCGKRSDYEIEPDPVPAPGPDLAERIANRVNASRHDLIRAIRDALKAEGRWIRG